MALQPIDIDTVQPNGKKGDPARVMSQKINANDTYLEGVATSGIDAAAVADGKAVAAHNTANAAAPKASPSFTGTISSTQTPLETGAGAVRTIFEFGAPNGDDDKMQLLAVRTVAGSGWTGVIWRFRRIVNGFQQGILEFGQPSTNTGVTIDGGRPWTSANTTVDGNNFIKRA